MWGRAVVEGKPEPDVHQPWAPRVQNTAATEAATALLFGRCIASLPSRACPDEQPKKNFFVLSFFSLPIGFDFHVCTAAPAAGPNNASGKSQCTVVLQARLASLVVFEMHCRPIPATQSHTRQLPLRLPTNELCSGWRFCWYGQASRLALGRSSLPRPCPRFGAHKLSPVSCPAGCAPGKDLLRRWLAGTVAERNK